MRGEIKQMNQTKQPLGLSTKAATKLLFEYGENKLVSGKKISALKIFAGQFRDLMIMILLACTVVSVVMGETVEALAIIVIVLLNAVLGFAQEFRTEKTLEALKNMAAPNARVIRDGKTTLIPAAEIVPGDVILLAAGDKIPADARLLEVVALQCDEAMLTGESLPVDKLAAKTGAALDGPGQNGFVYMGTIVTKGRGKAEAVATGMNTEMGKIAGMLHEIDEDETPLQKRLAQLGKYIAAGCLLICAIVSLAGILRGEELFDMLITGISLAVAAVPEGLPAIVTIALALAVSRILKRQALVKKLHSVETLGCANVICTDKTGTLTENKMTVRQLFTPGYNIQVEGTGHEQAGGFYSGTRRIAAANSPALKRLFDIAAECNNAEIYSPKGADGGRDRTLNTSSAVWETNGEPTETALLIMAAKAGVMRGGYVRTGEIPFDSDRKRMTVLVTDSMGRGYAFCKGAPDLLLERCKFVLTDSGVTLLTPAIKRQIIAANEEMAEKAMRVLGFAFKESPAGALDAETGLVFAGLAGMIDPPRKEAYDAVARCRQAKIKTVMITGDHKATAIAIARDLGILRRHGMVLTGTELDAMQDSGLDGVIHKVSVFARVNPGHKLRIVRAFKKRGDIVAMTGDGVNDAPAVKEADIGVSMGITGTDVTKQAASIILLDDNFATLVAAVEEGRVVYSNIRKFIRYLLSCNIGEVVTMFAGMLMGLPVVLLPIQILLVNLATDGLPAMALGLEPAEDGVMEQKPRPSGESVFAGGLFATIAFRGCLIGIATLAVFTVLLKQSGSVDLARTGALVTLVMSQLVHVFECKSERRSLLKINLLSNPALILAVVASGAVMVLAVYAPVMQTIFGTVALTGWQFLRAAAYALVVPVLSSIFMARPRKKQSEALLPMENPATRGAK